ncbi:MAG: hypothetical protein K0S67_1180 [Nitrososphaeraceae archaeon]|jgi:hypothetical protein|nr:hypothetical protein [Nitrososphaeraceae archaeon]MCD6037292.1 hypothetical protein [Nitrososphaeraceae archaeon]MDF2767835.1 hypothetical protein [Nitrososphaeraceae archaeon]
MMSFLRNHHYYVYLLLNVRLNFIGILILTILPIRYSDYAIAIPASQQEEIEPTT